MSAPQGFSWVEKPLLAALARPSSPEDLQWLRQQGIEVLLSLPRKTVSIVRLDQRRRGVARVSSSRSKNMEPPTQETKLDRCVSAITKAVDKNMPVAVHCGAGLGRTGVVLAAYLVSRGLSAATAIAKVRMLRPHSIETSEQAESVEQYARRVRRSAGGREEV